MQSRRTAVILSRFDVRKHAFLFTWVMLKLINLVTPVKVSASDEETGLDETLHGKRAYV